MSEQPLKNREIIFEIIQLGIYAKITAIDVATGTEASISGPASTPDPILKRNAINRLEFVLRKKGLIA